MTQGGSGTARGEDEQQRADSRESGTDDPGEPADEAQDEPVVSETMRAGYTWRGQLLRPAMVRVARNSTSTAS